MDKQFLEFWGNALLQAARGQAQMENISKWLSQAGSGVPKLTELFEQTYGLASTGKAIAHQSPDWQRATDRFNQAFEDYLALLNVVPLARYRELEEKNAALQKEVDRLRNELKDLRSGLAKTGQGASEEVISGLQSLLQKQQREFQDLTRQMSKYWRSKEPEDHE
jgi:Skp family chaperone for outer membrane proteins